MTTILSKKAVLASLTITQWSARRLDKRITDEVNREHAAVSDAGRFNKLLLKKSALEPIWKLTSEARTFHFVHTLPWLDTGTRLLPAKMFEDYTKRMHELRTDFERAADEFTDAYPEHVEERRTELNGMFRDEDYPAFKRVRSLFTFAVSILPCPDAGDFRVDLSKSHVADIKRQVEKRMKQALDDAMQEPVRRIVEVVGRMADRLNTYGNEIGQDVNGRVITSKFHDTLVDNVRELAQLLPSFNLTDDPALNKLAARIEKELCVEDAKTLRDMPLARQAVASSAEEILSVAKQFLA